MKITKLGRSSPIAWLFLFGGIATLFAPFRYFQTTMSGGSQEVALVNAVMVVILCVIMFTTVDAYFMHAKEESNY